jgi:hypothetical protein
MCRLIHSRNLRVMASYACIEHVRAGPGSAGNRVLSLEKLGTLFLGHQKDKRLSCTTWQSHDHMVWLTIDSTSRRIGLALGGFVAGGCKPRACTPPGGGGICRRPVMAPQAISPEKAGWKGRFRDLQGFKCIIYSHFGTLIIRLLRHSIHHLRRSETVLAGHQSSLRPPIQARTCILPAPRPFIKA